MNANRQYIVNALTKRSEMEISLFPLHVRADLLACITDHTVTARKVNKPSKINPNKIITYTYITLTKG